MKGFLVFISLLGSCLTYAETYEACYLDARNNAKYNIQDSSQICKGMIGDTCYVDARKSTFSVKDSADICRNVMNEACYSEAKRTGYNIKQSAELCRGLFTKLCYNEARSILHSTIVDAVKICRAGVVCQASK